MVMGAAANCIHLGAGTVWWSIGSTLVLVFACVCVPLPKTSLQAIQLMTIDLRGVAFALLKGSMRWGIMIAV